ncbi:DNA gyrase inhibitor YacG [Chitinibacter fontanus]|uniref:DNA gyrase inhibitor YacG n=2 Tax=Chitinibacter fontanus TaxID=1737446 RepID=A0A7D5ZCB4_9NEIS|nr:DNA gyrase inhibitor YacG [Chitinibacter fontanus]
MVKCPTCGTLSAYLSSNQYRPFCSARCKLIDLGEWANDNYRIPDTQSAPTPEDNLQ